MEKHNFAQSVARNATRRARRKASGGRFTKEQIDALYLKQKGLCAEPSCRVALHGVFDRDHIKPLAEGGSNDISNIQLLCEGCNHRKGAKPPHVWAREKGRLV